MEDQVIEDYHDYAQDNNGGIDFEEMFNNAQSKKLFYIS